MASSSSFHHSFTGIEPDTKRRKVSESSKLFDVFINHRGPDAKETLAAHLYNSLQELGLRAFLDCEETELGDYFPSTLETAIRSASVHIAIFSERYAQSAWCLAELVLMLQSEAKIFPLFYGVRPWELRFIENGVYADAFKKYKEKGRYLQKLESWEKALHSASFFNGLEINSAESFCNSEDFKNLVLEVQKEVKRAKPLFVAEHPVGLEKLVKDFESRCLHELVHDFENQCGLNVKGKDHSKIVGIFGMGGAGKTTLATELFNQKRSKYIRTCFLFDVREQSSRYGLPSLQVKLLRDLFNEDPPKSQSMKEGSNYIRDCLGRSGFLSFLIVIDDVDHEKQLDSLCITDMVNKTHNSLIIVTTRDVGVLTRAGITNRYNLKGLNRDDGRELFCWHSFGHRYPASEYDNLVDAFVTVCGGLPLSLQVLGRHVYARPADYWELQLCKVRRSLHQDIKDILKISFDALDCVEKQIFKDIACFFIDKSKNTAIRAWEGSGWHARYALQTLKDRCLVEERERLDGLLWEDKPVVLKMHDHLRDLGREMSNEVNSPPRHWSPQHCKSLESKGFQNILAETKGRCFHSIFDRSIGSKITYFIGESEEYGETATSLLWLHLDLNCGELSSIPPWIPLQHLQCLRISHGCLKRLWQSNVQAPSQLKELQIYQTTLEEFPDFLGISTNLEQVVLDAKDMPVESWSLLESLRVYPRSLVLTCCTLHGELACNNRGDKTTFKSSLFSSLVIRNFVKLSDKLALYNIGESTDLKCPLSNLENLEINNQIYVTKILICGNYCPRLLSLKIHDMEYLDEMNLLGLKTLACLEINMCKSLKRLSETSNFINLVAFNISQCPELEELSLARLTCLEKITIKNCVKLKSVSGLSNLRKLQKIEIESCEKLQNIYIEYCEKLQNIYIEYCEKLQNITLPTTLINLSVKGCRELQRAPGIGDLTKLTWMNISECPKLEELPSLARLNCLENIYIEYCEKLQNITLPTTLINLSMKGCRELQRVAGYITKLEKLFIYGCPELEKLPWFWELNCLEEIVIHFCEKLEKIVIEYCEKLEKIDIKHCEKLEKIDIKYCEKLEKIDIKYCEKLEKIDINYCEKLEKIDIASCEKLQNITLPTILIKLSVKGCRELQRVAGIGDRTKLIGMNISECPKLEELPSPSRLNCLENICIEYCEKLQKITLPTTLINLFVDGCRELQRVAVIGHLAKLKTLIIYSCPELEELPSLARLSCLEEIVIDSCEKLQNISGIEEMHASFYMKLGYCSNAVIRNCIHKLKSVPSRGMDMIGRAMDGAESTINEYLFSDAHIAADAVTDAFTHFYHFGFGRGKWQVLSAVIGCYVLVVDSSTSVAYNVPQGQWIVTKVASEGSCSGLTQVYGIMRYGIMKKGLRVEVKEGEEWKIVGVLSTIVDRLYL